MGSNSSALFVVVKWFVVTFEPPKILHCMHLNRICKQSLLYIVLLFVVLINNLCDIVEAHSCVDNTIIRDS